MIVIGKWRITAEILAQDSLRPPLPLQVHGDHIMSADELADERLEADGVLVNQASKQTAAVHTADCLPAVICTPGKALALHISRKTLIHGLLDRVSEFISTNEILGIYLGPHICSRHFTFATRGPEIIQFTQLFPRSVHSADGITHLSLRQAVDEYLAEWHVDGTLVRVDSACTYETPILPSYRRSLDTKTPLTSALVTSVAYS